MRFSFKWSAIVWKRCFSHQNLIEIRQMCEWIRLLKVLHSAGHWRYVRVCLLMHFFFHSHYSKPFYKCKHWKSIAVFFFSSVLPSTDNKCKRYFCLARLCLNTFSFWNRILLSSLSRTLHFPFNFQHMSVNKLSECWKWNSLWVRYSITGHNSWLLYRLRSVCFFFTSSSYSACRMHFSALFPFFVFEFRFYDLIQWTYETKCSCCVKLSTNFSIF